MRDWKAIVSEHQLEVWQTLCRLAPPGTAEQCFAATFLEAHQIVGRESISDWRLVLQHLAAKHAFSALRPLHNAPSTSPAQTLRQHLALMPEGSAIAFALRYLCSFSFQEVAMELRAPVNETRNRMTDVLAQLGRELSDLHGSTSDQDVSPAQRGDDLLEAAVRQITDEPVGPMPDDLPAKTVALLNEAPEIHFEKPPEPNYKWPIGIAAAALVAIAGLVYAYIATRPVPPAITFAQVAEAVASQRSVSYRVSRTLRQPDGSKRKVESQITSAEPGRIRQVLEPPDTIIIWNRIEQKALTLEQLKRRATLRDAADMFEETRPLDALTIVKALPAASAHASTQTIIDARRAQGFEIADSGTNILLWADIETHLPLMIEMKFGASASTVNALFSDFVWNPAVADDLLSLTPPDGYELNAVRLNLKAATETDLLRALGVAARLNGGKFPDQFDRAGMSQLIEGLYSRLPADKQSAAFRNASEALEADLLQLGRGWLFVSEAGNGADWHYAGAGVFYGSDSPVLWYRPANSRSYRVVDGTLSARQVMADRLPTAPSQLLSQSTTRPTLQLH